MSDNKRTGKERWQKIVDLVPGIVLGLGIVLVLRHIILSQPPLFTGPWISDFPQIIVPTPSPPSEFAMLVLDSYLEPSGRIQTVSKLSLNSVDLGVADFHFPHRMNSEESATVGLSLIPDSALLNLQALHHNQHLAPPPVHLTGTVDIYPVMEARLLGTGFEISDDGMAEKVILSDRPAEWTWNIKPKQRGKHSLAVVISIPVLVGSDEWATKSTHVVQRLETTIDVKPSWPELLPWMTALLSFVTAMGGIWANYRLKRREEDLKALQAKVDSSSAENAHLLAEIERIQAIPKWQFWRK